MTATQRQFHNKNNGYNGKKQKRTWNKTIICSTIAISIQNDVSRITTYYLSKFLTFYKKMIYFFKHIFVQGFAFEFLIVKL